MLKIIWIIDGILLVIAFSLAVFASGQDAAGKGVIWMFPLLLGAALAGSWASERMGRPTLALMAALSGVAVGLAVAGLFIRSMERERSQLYGREYWADPLQRRLADAIAHNDTTRMRAAISAGANINAVGEESTTPLIFAITQRPDMVGTVVKMGADPNLVRANVSSPLAIALNAPDPAFQQLLENGADANGPGDNESPIIFGAIRAQLSSRYEMLVAGGADVKRLDATGRSTLIAAAELGEWKIALDLLTRGVDVRVIAKDGASILSIVERARAANADNADYQQFVAAMNKAQSP